MSVTLCRTGLYSWAALSRAWSFYLSCFVVRPDIHGIKFNISSPFVRGSDMFDFKLRTE